MMKKNGMAIGWAVLTLWVMMSVCSIFPLPADAATGKKVLFDQGHGETAGNADWTITGGYSDFAAALRNRGYVVESTTSTLTPSLLSGYDVLILPEPNINFTASEKSAINSFVAGGGGVYFIADHYNSDRNNDGWDSTEIFNGYTNGHYNASTDWVKKTYGFSFDFSWYNQEPVSDIAATPLTTGVNAVGCWGGTTIYNAGTNSSITGDVYLSGYSHPFQLHGSYGSGRFAALGDSSLFDDGTGNPGDQLYDGWHDYDDSTLAVNTVEWLAGDR